MKKPCPRTGEPLPQTACRTRDTSTAESRGTTRHSLADSPCPLLAEVPMRLVSQRHTTPAGRQPIAPREPTEPPTGVSHEIPPTGGQGTQVFCRPANGASNVLHIVGKEREIRMRPAGSRGRGGCAGSGSSSGGRVRRGPEGRAGGGERPGAGGATSTLGDTLPLPLSASGPPPVFITADPPCTAAAGTSSQGAWGSIVAGMPCFRDFSARICPGYLRQMFMREKYILDILTAQPCPTEHAQAIWKALGGAERPSPMSLSALWAPVSWKDAQPCQRTASQTMPALGARLLSHSVHLVDAHVRKIDANEHH